AALGDDVLRLEVEMQPAATVQVADRRAQLAAELGEVVDAERTDLLEQGAERRAGERLEDEHGPPGDAQQLVGAHDVRMRDAEQDLALLDEARKRAVVVAIGAHDLA